MECYKSTVAKLREENNMNDFDAVDARSNAAPKMQ